MRCGLSSPGRPRRFKCPSSSGRRAPKWGEAHVGKRGFRPGGAGCRSPLGRPAREVQGADPVVATRPGRFMEPIPVEAAWPEWQGSPQGCCAPSGGKHMLAKGGCGREVRDAHLLVAAPPGRFKEPIPVEAARPGRGSRSRFWMMQGAGPRRSRFAALVIKHLECAHSILCTLPGGESSPGGRVVVVPPHESLSFWSVHIAYCAHSREVRPPGVRSGPWGSRWLAGLV